MALLVAHGLCKAFGPQLVLDRASVALRARERVGLVGANGVGKSTLARILAGQKEADQGAVSRSKGVKVAYLPQEPELDPGLTARATVLAGLEEWTEHRRRYDELTLQLETGRGQAEQLAAEQADVAAAVERLGGWDLLHRADSVMTQLGISDPERPLEQCSGGEQRRVALARILVATPALAIFDEPTNHLDADTIEWLERHLRDQYLGALLLITHDRYLLDRVVQRTLELERGKLYSYDGGWEDYLVAKAERQTLEARVEANRQNLLRTELEWMSRQPKARTGKQKARLQRIEQARAQQPVRCEREVRLGLEATRSGHNILELRDVTLELGGRRLVDALSLQLTKGERIGIIGPNGIGKTSLLKCLCRELPLAGGQLVWGKHTAIAYYEQGRAGLDDASSIQQNVSGGNDTVYWNDRPLSVFSYLENFMFFGDKQRQLVGSLSGGERARVALAKLLLGRANVLLLDEPTNDLDVVTLAALEGMLRVFGGTSLVVTHDRYFLDRVATSLLAFEGDGKVVHYPGNYSTYLRLRRLGHAEAATAARSIERAKPRRPARPKQALTYSEQLELAGLLDKVEAAEHELAELEAKLADPELYARRGAEVPLLHAELAQARAAVERLMTRWEELERKRESTGQ